MAQSASDYPTVRKAKVLGDDAENSNRFDDDIDDESEMVSLVSNVAFPLIPYKTAARWATPLYRYTIQ